MLHLVLFSMNVNIHIMQITNWLHIVLLGCTQLLCVITGNNMVYGILGINSSSVALIAVIKNATVFFGDLENM